MPGPAESLRSFIADHRSLAVISGAGISTGSGIPDYRDRNGNWKHSEPIQFGDFIRLGAARQRYWSRSYVGWQRFSAAEPNAGHRALAALEQKGHIDTLITQNVDRLHHAAGSARIIELHGALAEVRCLDCGAITDRAAMQQRLRAANPGWGAAADTINPDGDATLDRDDYERFVVPPCATCGGMLKPRVVFFGESVPPPRVEAAFAAVERADALLVAGTSLTVYSGLRFVRAAAERGLPIALVNVGPVRDEHLIDARVDGPTGRLLPALVERLLGVRAA